MSSNTASSSELPVKLAIPLSRIGDPKGVGILQIRDSVLHKKAFFKYFIAWTKIVRFTTPIIERAICSVHKRSHVSARGEGTVILPFRVSAHSC
jgi:hypothetical protein